MSPLKEKSVNFSLFFRTYICTYLHTVDEHLYRFCFTLDDILKHNTPTVLAPGHWYGAAGWKNLHPLVGCKCTVRRVNTLCFLIYHSLYMYIKWLKIVNVILTGSGGTRTSVTSNRVQFIQICIHTCIRV